jgi:phytoene synthase
VEFLRNPQTSPQLSGLVRKLLAEAEALYSRAKTGIGTLPLGSRIGIGAAHRIYAAIGQKISGAGYDTVNRRARVNGGEKLLLVLRAAAAIAVPSGVVHAAAVEVPPQPGSIDKLLLMFERLERSQREATRLTA